MKCKSFLIEDGRTIYLLLWWFMSDHARVSSGKQTLQTSNTQTLILTEQFANAFDRLQS